MPDDVESAAEAELQLNVDYLNLVRLHRQAKEAHEADRDDPAKAAKWREVKDKMREMRAYWRGVRRYQQDLAIAGNAEAMAKVQADIGEGGAVAAPAPHGMGATPQGV